MRKNILQMGEIPRAMPNLNLTVDDDSELLEHTWEEDGPLGVRMMPRNQSIGCCLMQVGAHLPSHLSPGLYVVNVNGKKVSEQSFVEIMNIIKKTPRPLAIGFKTPLEQGLLNLIIEEFYAADKDESGGLDTAEIAAVLHSICKKEQKMEQDLTMIQKEIDSAMSTFDTTNAGILHLPEFVRMVCAGNVLNLDKIRNMSQEMIDKVQTLAELHSTHLILANICKRFTEADTDESGALDKDEVAVIIKSIYKAESTVKTEREVEREVEEAIREFDTDRSGEIEFLEFVYMICNCESFTLKLSPPGVLKQEISYLAGLVQTYMLKSATSPLSIRQRHKHTNAAKVIQGLSNGWLLRSVMSAPSTLKMDVGLLSLMLTLTLYC